VRKPLVIGHRGSPLRAPENTVPSYLKAIEEGADFIEVDVRTTRDGELVIMHDSTVDRTTNGRGRVADMSLSEVKSLDAGSWFSEEYSGTRVPTLSEVLELARGKVGVVIELKVPGIETKVLEAVKRAGMIDDVIVLSSHWYSIKLFRQLEPRIPGLADMPQPTIDKIREVLNYSANIISFHKKDLSSELVKYAHRKGLLVNSWPINTREELEKCLKTDIDFITTDNPLLIRKILKEL